jgi:hypothetical protein
LRGDLLVVEWRVAGWCGAEDGVAPPYRATLLLRLYEQSDLDAVWGFERLPQVQQWLGWAPASRTELGSALDPAPSATTHVMVLRDECVIGHIMIMPRDG